MKNVENIYGLTWYRYTAFGGEGYGPYYLRDGGISIGSVNQCVGTKAHIWLSTVYVGDSKRSEKLSCYAWSRERAMYFVLSWAKYHYKRTV
jgi:hypothetical protein